MFDPEDVKRWREMNTPYPEKARPKHLIVLAALKNGQEIELDGYRVQMALDVWEADSPHRLGFISTTEKWEAGVKLSSEEVFIYLDWPMHVFMDVCEKLTTEEVFLIGAGTVLRHPRDKERP